MKRKHKPISPQEPHVLDAKLPTTSPDASAMENRPTPVLIGIDWADEEHTFAIYTPQGTIERGTVLQSPEAIAQWTQHWTSRFPTSLIHVCLETSRGAIINALLEHPQVRIFPVNPNALANYRKAFAHGGGKNDPVDAALILEDLQLHGDRLRPLQANQPLTRELTALCEDRRGFVEQRVVLAQQLGALLKAYFPAILSLAPAKVYADFIVLLIRKYPTLEQAQAAGPTKLRKLFFARGTKQKIEDRIEAIMNAKPLTTNEVLLRTSARRAQGICVQLEGLNQTIREYEKEIQTRVQAHANYKIVKPLPCGIKAKARIIAALGDDPARYGNATKLAAATGIAPLTTQSGKQRFVSSRWACTQFLKQTFHEFAGVSRSRSAWAKAYYQQQRDAGKTNAMACRALAYKWIRILYRCWQTGEAYDEERYMRRLKETGSPLAAKLAA